MRRRRPPECAATRRTRARLPAVRMARRSERFRSVGWRGSTFGCQSTPAPISPSAGWVHPKDGAGSINGGTAAAAACQVSIAHSPRAPRPCANGVCRTTGQSAVACAALIRRRQAGIARHGAPRVLRDSSYHTCGTIEPGGAPPALPLSLSLSACVPSSWAAQARCRVAWLYPVHRMSGKAK